MRDEAEGVDFQQLPSVKGSRTSKSVRARTEETNLRVKTVKVCGWVIAETQTSVSLEQQMVSSGPTLPQKGRSISMGCPVDPGYERDTPEA